jgi:hypothetical protein
MATELTLLEREFSATDDPVGPRPRCLVVLPDASGVLAVANLTWLDADTVRESVKAEPELWLNELLPAIVEGVLDAADWLTWNGPDGSTEKAINLVCQLAQLVHPDRIERFLGTD